MYPQSPFIFTAAKLLAKVKTASYRLVTAIIPFALMNPQRPQLLTGSNTCVSLLWSGRCEARPVAKVNRRSYGAKVKTYSIPLGYRATF
jgi:hypothetical protein